jgi:hypothetical protein
MKKIISIFSIIAVVSLLGLPSVNAADNASVTFTATVSASITLTAATPATLHISAGGVPVNDTPANSVSVTTTNSTGYIVKAKASPAALTSGSNTIPAVAYNAVTTGTSGWGIKVIAAPATGGAVTVGLGDGSTPITTTDQTIYSDSNATGVAEVASIDYKVAAASSQALGTYTTSVTYTAFPQ